jgi:hypothetical protein
MVATRSARWNNFGSPLLVRNPNLRKLYFSTTPSSLDAAIIVLRPDSTLELEQLLNPRPSTFILLIDFKTALIKI